MKLLKRFTAFLLVLVLVTANFSTVAFAATEGTTTTVDKTYRCVKGSDTGIAGTAPIGDDRFYWHFNADGTSLNSPIRFMVEKGTNTPVYCIEMGAEFETSTWDTHALTDSSFWNSLSAMAQRGITYTTMYGYPVNQYGAAKCDAYAATQTLIWEYQKGYRTLYGRTNDTLYDLMIKGSPAENAYNKIAAAVEAHAVRPSFAYGATADANANPVTLKYDGKGTWAISLTDTKGVLGGYDIIKDGGLTVNKSGNNLSISTTKAINGTWAITFGRPLPTTEQALLMLDSTRNQRCIVGQLRDPVYTYLCVTTEALGGKVSVIKENENSERLSGVTFSIYSDTACKNEITKITTGPDGTAVSGDLDISKYPTVYVKETAMTDSQNKVYKVNGTVYPVKLVSGSTVTANEGKAIVNEWKDGKVSVIKENENGEKLASVTFTVFEDKDCKNAITEITTGADGTGTSADIDVGKTGSRTVYVRETKMTDEHGKTYSMNGTVYPVTVKAGQTVTANDGKAVINEWKTGRVSVVKENENGEKLASVTFTVFDDKDCKTAITEITTGADGIGTSADIDVGKTGSRTVYVRETKMTDEHGKTYSMNGTVYPVTVKAGETTKVNDGNAVVNEWQTGRVSVIKENEAGEKLSGVTFTVYSDETCKTEITKITTGKDGIGTSADIKVNKDGKRTVYIRETDVTDQQGKIYKINGTTYSVTIRAGATVTANDGKAVINEWKDGRVSVVKENENGEKLASVTFTVFDDKDCKTAITEITTGADGIGTSANIDVGKTGSRTVYVKETKMTDEHGKTYSMNGTVYPVTVKAGQTVTANDGKPVINEWIPGKVSVVKENENSERLSDVTFTVYSDEKCENRITEMTTGKDGTATSGDISVGKTGSRTVYVKETSMTSEQGKVYVMNGTVYPVIIRPNTVSAVNNGKAVINEWKNGKVSVIKENEAGEKLASITFTVFDDKDCKNAITAITTGPDGSGTSADIDVGKTGSRDVFVKETAMTDIQGKLYRMNGTVYPVTVTAGATVPANSGKAIINEWLPGKLSVIKNNPDGEALAGAEFTAYTDKECKTVLTDVNEKPVVLTTDASGKAVSADIYVGKTGSRTIYVKETAFNNPDADIYNVCPDVFESTIQPGKTVAVNSGKPVINTFKPGQLKVVKENENGNRLAGVTFSVYSDMACREHLMDIVTDENGVGVSKEISIDSEASRVVYVRETSLPKELDGLYEVPSTVYKTIIFSNQTVQVNNGKTIIDNWKLGQLSLRKTNEADTPLKDVTFGVFEDEVCLTALVGADGKQVTLTTDENGDALSDGIKVNANGSRKLYVKELYMTADYADLYEINDTVFEVVASAGKIVPVNGGKAIINEWLPGRVSLEKITPSEKPVNGAVFHVYDNAEQTKETLDIDGNPVVLITDDDGFAESTDIKLDKNGSRKVYVVETEIISEWAQSLVVDTTKVYEAVLTPNGITQINEGYPVINRWYDGKLSLKKVTENDQPLAGVTFGVYDNPECTNLTVDAYGYDAIYTTDENGCVLSEDIPMVNETGTRTVYVKELSLTDEQAETIDINRNVFKVELLPAQNTAVNGGTVIDEWLPGQLELNKLDEDGNTMAGVVFGIFSDEKCTEPVYFEENTYTIETDDTGYAFSGGIRMDKDGTRTIYVRELFMTASDSDIYELNPTVFKVKLEAGKLIPVNDNEPIIDDFKTAPVKIKKSDFTTAEGVPGATIQIYDNNGELVYEGVTKKDGNTEEIELRVGRYTFVETIAPAGYVLNKTVFEFTINPDKTVSGDCEVTDKPVEWTITKQDVTTAEPLPSAEITIYDKNGKEVFRDKTKEDGTVTAFYLAPGEYTFKETYAPEGYVVNEEVFSFSVDAEGNVTGDHTVTDRRIVGSVRIIKKGDDGSKLTGAVFGLFTPDGKTELMRGTTGDDGAVTFENLEYGKYVVKELEAPIGFLMRATEFEVKVEEDGETVELEVTNTREPFVPKTGDDPTGTLIAVLLMLASAATIFMLWFTKRNKDFIHNLRRESGLRIESLKRRFSLS